MTNITGKDWIRILLNSQLNLTQKAPGFYCLGLFVDNKLNIQVCNEYNLVFWVYVSGDDGKPKPNNFNVYIYPRCECNLYEFHSRHGWRDSSFIIHLYLFKKSHNPRIKIFCPIQWWYSDQYFGSVSHESRNTCHVWPSS